MLPSATSPVPPRRSGPARSRRRTVPALAAAVAAAVSLGACAADNRPTDAAADGQRIRLAMMQPPRSALTPFSDDAFKLSRWSTAETLVVLDADGDAQPALSTAWSRTDDTTWTFEVRPGVRFHDGSALDAAAVVTALTAATVASPKPRILDGVELTAAAVDADTVTVRTAVTDPLLPQRLSSPQLAVLAPTAYTGGPVSPVGTGTGPFELVAVDGTSGATLDRFDGYWGTPAAASGIDVQFVPDGTARAAALRTGTADVVESIPVSQAPLIDPQLIHEVPMPRTNTLYLNTTTGVFADPAVRRAARAAIDPAGIVERVYEGRADIAAGLLGPALPWAQDRPLRSENASAAADLPATKPRITLGTFTDRAELPEVAVLLEQQLEAVGFDVEQVVREYSFIESDALAGTFDAFILSRATVLDSGDPVAYLYSDFTCAGSFNIAQLCDPAVDAAVTAAAGVPAGPDRRTAVLTAEKAVLDTDAAIPMLHERVIQGEQATVTGAARDPRERSLITAGTRVG